MRSSKKKAQRKHAQRRACERYGLTFGPETHAKLCTQIKNGRAIFLERQSLRVTMFAVYHDGQWIPVVYDTHRHTIVTFLPLEALKPYTDKINAEEWRRAQ